MPGAEVILQRGARGAGRHAPSQANRFSGPFKHGAMLRRDTDRVVDELVDEDGQHLARVVAAVDISQQPKQATRLLKIVCDSCGYTMRVTAMWLAKRAPLCDCAGFPQPFRQQGRAREEALLLIYKNAHNRSGAHR